MAFPDNPRDAKVSVGFGHTDAEDPTTVAYEQVSPNPADPTDPGPVLGTVEVSRGRIGDSPTTDPTRIETALRNTGGVFSRRNVSSPYRGRLRDGTPMRLAVDTGSGDVPVATAFVPSWSPTWRGPGIDERVPIRALGVLAKMGEDAEVQSALRRTISASRPIGYWPLEDGSSSGVAGSGLPGGAPATVIDPSFTTDGVPPGSAAVLHFGETTRAYAPIDASQFSAGWAVGWIMRAPDPPADSTVLMEIELQDHAAGVTAFQLVVDANFVYIVGRDSGGSQIFSSEGISAALWDAIYTSPDEGADWLAVTMAGSDAQADLLVQITYSSNGLLSSGFFQPLGAGSSGRPRRWTAGAGPGLAGMGLGHVVAKAGAATPYPTPSTPARSAYYGYAGETAADRIARTAAEAGATVVVQAGDTAKMGPQRPATLLGIWRDCEATDHGVLYELRDGRPTYQPNSARYSLPVSLTLQYGTPERPGDIADLQQIDDDRDVRNWVRVSMVDGSSAVVERRDGPVGIDELGRRPLPVTLNIPSDKDAPQHAGWLLHHGTIDQPRHVVTLSLRGLGPELRDAILACDIGTRIRIEGAPPEHVGPADPDLIIEGEQGQYGPDRWVMVWHCEPYAPWDVGAYADDDDAPADEPARYDTAGCETLEGLWLPGASGAYASTPDTAVLDITGDFDLRASITPGDWTPSTNQAIISKYDAANGDNRSYKLRLNSTGFLRLDVDPDGTGASTRVYTANARPQPPRSGRLSVRVTLDVDTGSGQSVATFYTSEDQDLSSASWTQLGDPQTSTVATIFASSAALEVGSRDGGTGELFAGVIHAVQVRSGVGGTVVADVNFDTEDTGDVSIVDDAGLTWTVHGDALVCHDFRAGADTRLLVLTTLGPSWTTDPDDLPMRLRCGDSVLEVTAVDGAGQPQLLTVSTVNGVEKTITPGTPISLARPAIYAL